MDPSQDGIAIDPTSFSGRKNPSPWHTKAFSESVQSGKCPGAIDFKIADWIPQ
jgi:hypothetical protein